ncbi:MAG: hypothetical protein RBT65_02780 [Methanolobus sp.]|nr:hypothetical protein [Methanolobus sp.]
MLFPFLTAFFLSYISFRDVKLSLLGGVVCIPIFLIMTIVPFPYIVNGLISGLISCLIIWYIFYKTTKSERISIRGNLKKLPDLFSAKNITILVIALLIIGILFQADLYKEEQLEFKVTDPKDDVGTGWQTIDLNGHEYVDILAVESRLVDDQVILEIQLAENIPDRDTVEYKMFIFTTESAAPEIIVYNSDMEKDGSILRYDIPVRSLNDRNVFRVRAYATENNSNERDGSLYDTCAAKNDLADNLELTRQMFKQLIQAR